jgi:hypothetical protein
MKKPQKVQKTMRKSKERPPEDQQLLETQCGFCMKQFPDPTTARIHLDGEHPGVYA